ncbi:MAG: phosphoenolpyruvate--protein phosphotransferase [Fusobacteriaceae bacterium]|nr:phosphoenolpyruvate--protein phosphotransferase [Fusobacteriaceae bacterium]MBP9509765.1 phosphoenolpyruvate--protein phosphotransferase [Fusobacteriaceae bacterium]
MNFEKKGKSACEGVAISQGVIYKKDDIIVEKIEILSSNIAKEIERFKIAVKKSVVEIMELKKNLKSKFTKDELEILTAHLVMLNDPMYKKDIEKQMENEKINAEYAVKIVSEKYINLFNKMKNPIYAQRALDIKDISERIILNLFNKELQKDRLDNKIIFAKEILPSQLLKAVDAGVRINGLVLEYGGVTSHVAILAKSLNIPTLMGVEEFNDLEYSYDIVILDSRNGFEKLILKPTDNQIKEYQNLCKIKEEKEKKLKEIEKLESITKDGVKIELKINIGSSKEILEKNANYIDGVGLYRSELMYMESLDFPKESEQLIEYEALNKVIGNKDIVIRTLDTGADKTLPYFQMPQEENPFLGVRGVRYSLRNKEIFKTQIRAILEVSDKNEQIRVMYPMVTNCKEIIEIKKIVEECKSELDKEGIKYNKNIKQGIMVEVPSAALLAEQMSKYVDFFSIGTNDLTQYVLATDRLSESLVDLYDFYEPSVLMLIDSVAKVSKKYNKPLCVCGEVAGDRLACLAFLSMGIKEFSMVNNSIKSIKAFIREVEFYKLENLRKEILNAEKSQDVKNILNEYLKKIEIEL